jgi:CheY-like chemotaxis protein
LELGDGLWRIEADTDQISQVFQNIIINADQAMPDGGVVFIKAANMTTEPDQMPDNLALSPDGSYVQIDILDQGGGIAPEQMSKIFDPYFSTKDEGTGLGLATAHSVITQHGGIITVESRLGQGTTFTVYLPAITTVFEEPTPEEPETEFTALDVGEHDGHILVLDDEEMILSLVKQILTRFGYSVVVTTDGAETLSLYQEALMTQHPFDMVILDLTVPGGKGGKDVIQELRALNPDVHAIVSSDYYNDPVLANYREYGFDGMVAKPYKVHDLLQVIQRTLTGSSS